MNSIRMALPDSLTDEELIKFLHRKKTEISSCIEEPLTFLNQLRDHDLVPEDLYQRVIKMKTKGRRQKGVYDILNWVENNQGQHVKLFWSCVFKDHILREYPRLRDLQNSLLDGSFRISEKLPKAEEPSSNTEVQRKKKKQEQKKGATKRKKSGEETDEGVQGPSSVSSKKKQAVKPPHCCVQIAINLPNAETQISNTEVERKEKKQKKGATKRKKIFVETDEEERGPSSVSNQKTPDMKPPLCSSWIPEKIIKEEEPSSNTEVERKEKKQEQKKGATKRKKSGKETHEERGPSSVFNQKIPAMKSPLSQLLEKGELPVTCGDKEGILYPDQLARGGNCILSQGVWFTPCGFEKFSGRGNSKNWKISIRCQNITLHKLIQEGKLQCRDKKVRRE
ncbi:nuclear body protein SP140-like protein [Ictalurus punctatus]|uniref:Nuclear body protein SP140-like protein n=1 Tax=Ictalurus punctatus TaxID=7998 RepID=A0A2D0S4G4_ICTPU|nr:nuclear body protein SP140-like protein [Ictalurus punctatus]